MSWREMDAMSPVEMRDYLMARSEVQAFKGMFYCLVDMGEYFQPAFSGKGYVSGAQVGHELVAAGVVDEDKVSYDGDRASFRYFDDDEATEFCRRLQNYIRWKLKHEPTPVQRGESYRKATGS